MVVTDFSFRGIKDENKKPIESIIEMSNENEEVLNRFVFTQQEKLIINTFTKFYANTENMLAFINVIGCKTNISIRLIEHFITSYARTNNTVINGINIYNNYDQQLKTFHKKYFDPFSRGERIPWFANDYCVITTIAQLNFFKWFISLGIQEYIEKNYLRINNDMLTIKKTRPKKRKQKSISTTESPIYMDTICEKKINSIKLAQSLTQTLTQVSIERENKKMEAKKLIVDFMF
jgi:hypothetical protein